MNKQSFVSFGKRRGNIDVMRPLIGNVSNSGNTSLLLLLLFEEEEDGMSLLDDDDAPSFL